MKHFGWYGYASLFTPCMVVFPMDVSTGWWTDVPVVFVVDFASLLSFLF